MDTPTPRARILHGPQTWARIREAYLAGASASHLSEVYGPKVATIRARAIRERWTRTAQMLAAERDHPPPPLSAHPAPVPAADTPETLPGPPPTPASALDAALARAATALAAGDDARADAALKRGETLARLAEVAARLRPRTMEDLEAARHDIWLTCVRLAEEAAEKALTDPVQLKGPLCEWAYTWRAQTLGPDCAAADKRRLAEWRV